MDKHLFFEQLHLLIQDEPNIIANLANISAFLNQNFDDINWVGFYLVEKDNPKKELVLGPFQGKVACIRIPFGQGVCGNAALRKETIRVLDVHQFVGHIACDAESLSEIVIPIIVDDEVIGVLDIDSPSYNRFTLNDQMILEDVVKIIEKDVFCKA
ncbi:MAG: GAF domain-containing protein [Longibaculum muris]|uniref:GAF domain-containing protein n=1 Tax=Longibaculum muris TaxID=1796628 RepID=A0A4R3YMN6_9FIRM|nr:GAF domain-containing protein [Longibaculum muris]MBS5368662.1 GAF domain-containing protein [Coprobacillus cateniformis]MCR1889052.1 GAF domain-containing protein [Longibaculum muris]MED9811191.1 GAF domain-containing protein [Longibaculum muris]TCV93570.1 GAF domain-containing protein [Longibaculum muris]